ncbi:MAG: sugar ABC transporter ATP-binding protein [Armatimonadota bacterium]
MSEPRIALQMTGISKRFAGTLAVDGVDFAVHAGEVHALLGENGAGKSTLMKVLAGSFSDYTGEIHFDGQPVTLHSPAQAKARGIAMIHQELSLALPLSIAENVLVGRLPARGGIFLDSRRMIDEARACLQRVGLTLDPLIPIEDISQHEAQLVEIAKALGGNPRILVMDEPTSALSREEVERLFAIIHRLREEGLAIIYISHHLPEIFQVADRVTVLRDGMRVATETIGDVTPERLVELMVGRKAADLCAVREAALGAERLRVEGLSRYGFFHDVSFSIRAGEIVGLCGLSGAGRSELARSLCGIDPLDAGTVYLGREKVSSRSYSRSIRRGIAYLPEDRKQQGLALRLDVRDNVLSAVLPQHCTGPFYFKQRGQGTVQRLIDELQVSPPDPSMALSNLSGGNQQKVLLAKWLAIEPEVLILDEPTRGVDVGAKFIIHEAVRRLADRGKAVLLISSDLPELVALSDRMLVMRKGHLIGELPRVICSEESVLLAANGQLPEGCCT